MKIRSMLLVLAALAPTNGAAAATGGPPPNCPNCRQYAVKDGDTRSSIARQFGTTPDMIRLYNPDQKGHPVRVGETIWVPAPYRRAPNAKSYVDRSKPLRQWLNIGADKAGRPFAADPSDGADQLESFSWPDTARMEMRTLVREEAGVPCWLVPGDTLDGLAMGGQKPKTYYHLWSTTVLSPRLRYFDTKQPADSLFAMLYGPVTFNGFDYYAGHVPVCNNGFFRRVPAGAPPPYRLEREAPPPPPPPPPPPAVPPETIVIPLPPAPTPAPAPPEFQPSAYYLREGVVYGLVEMVRQFDKPGLDLSRDKYRFNVFSGLRWKVIQTPNRRFFLVAYASPNLLSNYYYYGYYAAGLGGKPLVGRFGILEVDAGFWHEDVQYPFRQYTVMSDRVHVEEHSLTFDGNGWYGFVQGELPWYTHAELKYEQGSNLDQRVGAGLFTEPYLGSVEIHVGGSWKDTRYDTRTRHFLGRTITLPPDETRQQEVQLGLFLAPRVVVWVPLDKLIYESPYWRAEEVSKAPFGLGFEWRTVRQAKITADGRPRIPKTQLKIIGHLKYLTRTNINLAPDSGPPVRTENDLLRAALGLVLTF